MNGQRFFLATFCLLLTTLSACGGSGATTRTNSAPAVTGIQPSTLHPSAVQQTFTVDGTNFQTGLSVKLQAPSGTMNPTPSQVSATSFQISAILSAGSYTITVSNPDGSTSSSYSFSVKAATGISFAPRVDYASGASASGIGLGSGSIAIGDFNGDGKLDIAVSNYDSNSISVFLNKGDGSFGVPIITPVNPQGALGLGPIVAGDFNEDGKLDLIVSTIAGLQSNIVLLSNGDGTFTQCQAIPNTSGFFQARVADLSGNKHLDVVAGGNGNMSVAMGKGDGTFELASILPHGPLVDSYIDIALGDLAGNQKQDIVAVDWTPNASDIVVFNGNGDGTFQAPTTLSPMPMTPVTIALADFNGDGKPDLLLSSHYAQVELALGNGDGTFNTNSLISVFSSQDIENNDGIFVRSADFDLDGKPDALILDRLAGQITVILNNGTSPLSGSQYTLTAASGICDVAVGDLNGDGLPDIVLVNNLTNQISVFLSNSN